MQKNRKLQTPWLVWTIIRNLLLLLAMSLATLAFSPLDSLPPNYHCPDMAGVTLALGDRAFIAYEKVNLRSFALVPSAYSSNIVAELVWGTTLSIIGGPQCAHEGTWWQVRTDAGQIGWVREFLSGKRLLEKSQPAITAVPSQGLANPIDGGELVAVPAGYFTMGLTNEQLITILDQCPNCAASAFQASMPAHQVYLSNYWIYKYEVTNRMYSICVNAGECTTPKKISSNTRGDYYYNAAYQDYPVVHVDWYQADQYCQRVGARLPTEAEWEKAARGTDARLFPWGNQFPDSSRANVAPFVNDTTRVGTYPLGASPYGVYDMAGNVYEWVSDWFASNYYSSSPVIDPLGPAQSNHNPLWRSVKGASWGWTGGVAASGYHDGWGPGESGSGVGFRCVIDIAG